MSKDFHYSDLDFEAILAQKDDGVDPFAAAKQDLSDNQDPDHSPADVLSPVNCVILESVPPFQRDKAPLVARFIVIKTLANRFIGNATAGPIEARVMQPQRTEGIAAIDEGSGAFTQLDLRKPRRTNSNAEHVPIRDISFVDLTNATSTFLNTSNNGRVPIGGRPVVSFHEI